MLVDEDLGRVEGVDVVRSQGEQLHEERGASSGRQGGQHVARQAVCFVDACIGQECRCNQAGLGLSQTRRQRAVTRGQQPVQARVHAGRDRARPADQDGGEGGVTVGQGLLEHRLARADFDAVEQLEAGPRPQAPEQRVHLVRVIACRVFIFFSGSAQGDPAVRIDGAATVAAGLFHRARPPVS
ncbi:MAG: hypothetical protein GXP62_00130, partial [Oligoflexia bacterium]|nr:hypothetical protein [Oligoflexia bacterium]